MEKLRTAKGNQSSQNCLRLVSLYFEIFTKERFCSATNQFIHKGHMHVSERQEKACALDVKDAAAEIWPYIAM